MNVHESSIGSTRTGESFLRVTPEIVFLKKKNVYFFPRIEASETLHRFVKRNPFDVSGSESDSLLAAERRLIEPKLFN